jgi:signal peptidase I
VPGDRDLCPAGIAAQGVTAILKNLEIQRDVYYRAVSHSNIESVLAAHVASPREWAGFYQANSEDDEMSLQVDPDGFLALGDNSPRSKDSRMWAPGMQSVPRNNLVGRAFYIYWPHGVPFMNGGRGYPLWYHKQIERTRDGTTVKKVDDYPKWTAPFYPQIDRMKRIR